MVKIRLARHGVKKRPFFKIVIADSRFRRDGRFIEKIGFFNPIAAGKEQNLFINIQRVKYWIQKGAQLSNRVKYLIKNQTQEKNVQKI
ncbi:30S ribosomal protein S16 [Buchnera aphidicola (Eriosoma lanigerum)]|uniref:30S ribosomal protein S16 n=1 Tax=Buchnera aphidicola TaxID=9 RepID=UPI003463FBAB